MDARKSSCLAGAIALAVGLTAGWVDAPEPPADLMIRGSSACDPDGTYSLNWVVINPEANTEVTLSSAEQSGVHSGEVYLDPSRLKANQSATGSDVDVPGKTEGTVVLTVQYVFNDTGGQAESSGSIHLDGSCKKSSESSGPSQVDGNRPTRVDDD